MSRRTWSRRTWPALTVSLSLLVSLLVLPTPRTVAADAGPAVAAPPSPTFALSQADQDPGAFVISGFSEAVPLLVAVGFVDPPAGVSFSLPVTAGLTASFGYVLTGNHTQISFTGSMAAANTALAAMRVSTGSAVGGITIRVSASESQSNVFYNPINGHYYEYVARADTFAYAPANTAASAVHLAEQRTLFGVRGYLATITDAQEQAFVFANVQAADIWIAGSDAFEPLKERVAGYSAETDQTDTEGKWYWIAGPEAGTQFWSGATGGQWIHRDTGAELSASDADNAAVARYENWCTGNAGTLSGGNLAAGATFTLKVRGTSPRSSNVEPNNSPSEHYLLEKWSGAPCWNDWGQTADGLQNGFLVEYSEDWGDPEAPAGAWNERRGRFASTDTQRTASATVTALVDNAPGDVTATTTATTATVSWSAPATGTVTQYAVTATPGGATCTTAATSCTVSGLSPTTSYTFTVRATFDDAATADSLPSPAAVTAANTPPPPPPPPAPPAPPEDVPTAPVAPTAPAAVRPAAPATPPAGRLPEGPVLNAGVAPRPTATPVAQVGGTRVIVSTVPSGDTRQDGTTTVSTATTLRAGSVDLTLDLAGAGQARTAPGAAPEIAVTRDAVARTSGGGLAPGSELQVWLPLSGSDARPVTTLAVAADGTFSGGLPFDGRADRTTDGRPFPIGTHVLQLSGIDAAGRITVIEQTIRIEQPAPAPEADRSAGAPPSLSPGASIATNGGVPEPVTVIPEPDSGRARIEGPGWTMAVDVTSDEGGVTPTADGGAVVELVESELAVVSGDGFMPGTRADVWLFSAPVLLGTVLIGPDGTFDGQVTVDGVDVGEHTLQLQGVGADGYVRAANLGVVVTSGDDAATAQPDSTVEIVNVTSTAPTRRTGSLALMAVIAAAAVAFGWRLRDRRLSARGPRDRDAVSASGTRRS